MKPTGFVVMGACVSALLAGSCAAPERGRGAGGIGSRAGGGAPVEPGAGATVVKTGRDQFDVQSLVMKMADDYSIALNEAMRPIVMGKETDPTARQLAEWFQRNGMGSAIDIAAGPNPDAAILDMLVLGSLQRWSFSSHWIGQGIPEAQGRVAAGRLKEAEDSLWASAGRVLSDAQQATLRSLIDAWIARHPDRFVVSFVRFGEFVDVRNDQTLASRTAAAGLLKEVSEASAVVDSARLLGERALWYAARYPLVLGHQVETTAYRLADQPEVRKAVEGIESLKKVSDSIAARVDSLSRDMDAQREALLTGVREERGAAVKQAKEALAEVAKEAGEDLSRRVATAREETVRAVFDRFATERRDLLDDLQSREGALREMMNELRGTVSTTTGLAKELTGTVDAIDRVVARFDQQSGAPGRKPLEIKDVRDAAIEATKAAEKLTILLEKTNELAGSDVWEKRMASLERSTSGVVDRAFWRGLVLVLVLVSGLGVVRMLPRRGAGTAGTSTSS